MLHYRRTALHPYSITDVQSLHPYSITDEQLYILTALQTYSFTSLQHYILTALQTNSFTTLQHYRRTALQPYSIPDVQLYILTALQRYSITSLQYYRRTALHPYTITDVQLYILTALQTYSITSLQYYRRTALHPYSITDVQLYILTPLQTYSFTALTALLTGVQPNNLTAIVNRGNWLGSPANFKGANKDVKIYVGRSATLHYLLFCPHTLYMNYVTKTFLLVSSSISSKQLLCFVHGRGQKGEQKHTTKNFDKFLNHSPLLTMLQHYSITLLQHYSTTALQSCNPFYFNGHLRTTQLIFIQILYLSFRRHFFFIL